MRAELDGLICSGPMREKQHTYALLAERAPRGQKFKRDEALAELAWRYVSGHGPAQTQDLAWWSGLTTADALRGLESNSAELEQETIDGKVYWRAPSPTPLRKGPVVHLLPNYDELLIAFKDRSAMWDPRITQKTGLLTGHFVVIDGRIAGSWHRTLSAREVLVSAKLLLPLTAPERARLKSAAESYARSLGLQLRLEVEVIIER